MCIDGLREVEWETHYETGYHDLVDDFYVPALSRAVQYDRKAGFFSSDALAVAAAGVARLLKRGGRMRLLVGVRLSEQDARAIAEGYRRREEVIAESLARDWAPTEDEIRRERLAVLAEMVARGLLEIKVVAAVDEEGRPLSAAEAEGMFHQKAGIFTDAAGAKVAFVGSINETEAGWRRNVEELQVFCSWRADAAHVEDQVRKFEALWGGEHPQAQTFDFPEALRQRLLELRPEEPPERDPLEPEAIEEREAELERERWLFQFIRDAPLLENGMALVEEFAAVKPFPHQRRIYRRVVEEYPQRWFMLCDEVGLGKTIEAGFILRALLLRQEVERVLILAPKHLIRQWQEELREKFNLWSYWYDGKEYRDPLGGRHEAPEHNPWDADFRVIIASAHLAKRRGRMDVLLQAREWDLVMVDEAHHARRRWGPGSEHRPNRMLRLLERLRERTRCMILITATPMQIDVRELWDLLRLVGMEGRWAENWGEDFKRYFETLQRDTWSLDDIRFLCEMVREYFSSGGEPDEQIGRQMQRAGGFTVWAPLTSGQPVRPERLREALQNPRLGPLLRELFRRHTPVRQFMFRYTRAIMRKYRARGVVHLQVPEREVHDEFISLGPAQELYERIEEYISSYYKRAQAEKRYALGYVLTIYRQRLTSSPWAIYQTLRRHRARLLGREPDEDWREEFAEEDVDLAIETEVLDNALDREALAAEIEYIEDFLWDLRALGTDPKLHRLIRDIEELRGDHPKLLVFTQYTDTMDFIREQLVVQCGPEVACYSGRGGEVWDPIDNQWRPATKEEVKQGFMSGRFNILVCTEAASEGLNLQESDLLINYDMPWNPMRVDQRIGRIDRIGQPNPHVYVLNYFYQGTVEAEIYSVLADRIGLFRTAVGPFQPVLGRVSKAIEQVAMTPPAERHEVLEKAKQDLREAADVAEAENIDLDELAASYLTRDESHQPPVRPEVLAELFVHSRILRQYAQWTPRGHGSYELSFRRPERLDAASWGYGSKPVEVTFHQIYLEAYPDRIRHCLAWGDPLFAQLLSLVPSPAPHSSLPLARVTCSAGSIAYLLQTADESAQLGRIEDLRDVLEASG